MSITATLLPSENFDPQLARTSQGGNFDHYQSQHETWTAELRRADERAVQLRHELQKSHTEKEELRREIESLNDRLNDRDLEIKRLQVCAPVASKSTLDARQTHDTI